MSDELKSLLFILGTSLPAGVILGILGRMYFSSLCKKYAKFCQNKKWPVFAFGVILFALLAVFSFTREYLYFGLFFTGFCLLELFCFFFFGFKGLASRKKKRLGIDRTSENLDQSDSGKKEISRI